MVLLDAVRDVLKENRLAGPRRGHDQRALPLADRRHEIDHAGRAILDRRILDFHLEPLIGVERREVLEGDLVPRALGLLEIDLRHRGQREIAFGIVGLAHLTLDRIAGAQRILPDHVGRDIDIVRAGQVIGLDGPQETEPVLQHLEHPVAIDQPAILRPFLQDREHHLALAHGRGILDLEFLRNRQEILGRKRLEIGQVHTVFGHGHLEC